MTRTLAISAFILMGITLGCGGSGSSNAPKGKVCGSKYNPIPLELKGQPQKVDLDPSLGQLVPGDYTYEGSEIFYKNTATKTMIHVVEGRSPRTKLFVKSTACVAGLKPEGQVMRAATALSNMYVGANGIKNFDVRDIEIRYQNMGLKTEFKDRADHGIESPKKVYEDVGGGTDSQYVFYKMSTKENKTFQARSVFTVGTESVSILVRFKREDPTEE